MTTRINKIHFSKSEEDDIISSYSSNESMCSIGERYNVSNTCIKRLLKELGVFNTEKRTSKYTLNHNAFENSPPEEIFYWAGFIAADGCISVRSDSSKRIVITLHTQDVDILEKFNIFVGTNKPIYFYKDKPQCSVTICSTKMVESLAKFNITSRKTLMMSVPDIVKGSPHERHFWRGVIDGDGTIGFGKYSPFCGIVGTEDICTNFTKFCNSLPDFKSKMKICSRKGENLFSSTVLSRNSLIIIEELYRDCTIYMDRKFKKSADILDTYQCKIWVKNTILDGVKKC